jgi:hypothetical protein
MAAHINATWLKMPMLSQAVENRYEVDIDAVCPLAEDMLAMLHTYAPG